MAPITSLYAALGALLLLVLTAAVITRRRSAGVGIGDGGDRALSLRIRAHGNAIETLPIGLLLLLLLELGGADARWLHGLGATLLVGRALHAWGLSGHSGVSFGRLYGMLLTLLANGAMAIMLLLQAFARLAG